MKTATRTIRAALPAAIALILTFTVSGCVTHEQGTRIDPDTLARIVKGTTTREEAERLLGQPSHVSMLPDGKRLLHYSYISTSGGVTKGGVATAIATTALSVVNPIAGMMGDAAQVGTQSKTRAQTLQVLVSAAGVVEDYELTDGTTTATSGVTGATVTKTRPTEGAR